MSLKTRTTVDPSQQQAFGFADTGTGLSQLHLAEQRLLQLADYLYGHSPLKPMSKTLFFLSRCLLATARGAHPKDASELVNLYEDRRRTIPVEISDDFSFSDIARSCEAHLPQILDALGDVVERSQNADILGLAFNTLLRGKWESGEGLGTYLTPEEIVAAMTQMSLRVVDSTQLANIGDPDDPLLVGDICGGTGRFVHALARQLLVGGVEKERVVRAMRLFDQSSLAVNFARINFSLEDLYPAFTQVSDSLTAGIVSETKGRFLVLATNPPFGTGKYSWSEELGATLPPPMLAATGIQGPGDTADPAAVFLLRNLDLLAEGGVLAIVLPDGLLHSSTVRRALEAFETVRGVTVEIAAIVSLPAAAFSLGGTVAKTSFVLIQRMSDPGQRDVYFAEAKHVGFLKRGNRRVPDPAGDDLVAICDEFVTGRTGRGRVLRSWRTYPRLSPSALLAESVTGDRFGERLGDLVQVVRKRTRIAADVSGFHISILDVDETGFVDLLAASRNRPSGDGLECRPGDILLSCINPRIWRVAVVPQISAKLSCSPEFLVLRPRDGQSVWRLALRLHHPAISGAVQSMASGTSSSRQRVPKDQVLDMDVPEIELHNSEVEEHARQRERCYCIRLADLDIYSALHSGGRITG